MPSRSRYIANFIVSGNDVANASITYSDLGLVYTDNVTEGVNLFYTNARVLANVTSYLPNYAGNIGGNIVGAYTDTSIIAGSYEFNFSTAGNVSVPNAVRTNILWANTIQNLTTSNLNEGTNLYFTNARARTAISVSGSGSYDNSTGVITITGGVSSVGGATGGVTNNQLALAITSSGVLTTSNVSEGTNLYFTNSRVTANVTSYLPNYTGNVGGNLVGAYANTHIVANVYEFIFDNAGNVNIPNAVRANVLYANTIQNLTTSNLTEGTNLYYTNARVYAAVTSNLAAKANVTDLTTSNVTEGTNLYYTNARVYAAVTGNLAAKANVTDLTTSNVTEGTNLYFTNARVTANVVAYLPSYTGNVGGNLVGAFTNSTIVAGTSEFTFDNAGNVIVPNAVRANILYANTIQNLTTSNLTEGTNLYYTNARVYAAVTGNLAAKANVTDLTTSNVTEGTNLYYTNARVYAAVTGNLAAKANVTDLTTSNVTEGTNLYFTNARSYANVTSLLPAYTGNIAAANVYAGNLTLTGNISVANIVGTYTNTSIFADTFEFIFNNSGNVIIPNAIRANVLYANTIQNLTTSNLTEGTNLYFTNARALANITSYLTTSVTVGNLVVTGNLTVSGNTVIINAEELYLADNQIVLNSNHSGSPTQDAGILVNRGSSANVDIRWNESTDRWTFSNDGSTYYNLPTSTTDVAEGTNLYFTNARSYANVISLLPSYTGNVSGNFVGVFTNTTVIAGTSEFTFDNAGNISVPNAVRANVIYANVIQNLTTSNLTEGTNLYFTNARAYANTLSAIKTGNGISYNSSTGNITLSTTGVTAATYGNASIVPSLTVDAFGRITSISNITIGTSAAIETTQTFTANGTGNTFVLTATPTTANTLVFVDGLLQFPTTHYTFSGNTLIFTDSLLDGEGIYVISLLSGGASILSPIGGLTPGVYGNATTVPSLTLDTYGRVTAVSNSTITASNPDDAIIFSLLLSGM